MYINKTNIGNFSTFRKKRAVSEVPGCDKSKCSIKRLMQNTVPTLGSFYERRLSQLDKVIYKVHFFNYSLNILPTNSGNHIVLKEVKLYF